MLPKTFAETKIHFYQDSSKESSKRTASLQVFTVTFAFFSFLTY